MTTTDDDNTPDSRRTPSALSRLIQLAASPDADLSAFSPTMADVIRSLGQRVRSQDAWEVARAIIGRLLLQGMTTAEIALELGITPERAERWKARYYQDLRRSAATMQPRDFIMESRARVIWPTQTALGLLASGKLF